MRWARAVRVASGALLLAGCAQQPAVFDPVVPRSPAVSRPGRAGFVIAAPQGTTDAQTRDLAAELARRTGFGFVVGTEPQGPLAFYAEIRGGSRRDRIEIAAVGADASLAGRLRVLYELIRDAHLRAHPGVPRVEAAVEPAPARAGAPRPPSRTLHLEVPRPARADAREPYLAILAEFLTQAAALPAGR